MTWTRIAIVAVAAGLAGLVGVVGVEPALAAAGAVDVQGAGRNIGETLRLWSVSLFAGGTAIMASFYLLQRKVAPAVGFFALAMLVGGFVFAPKLVGELSESLWRTALG